MGGDRWLALILCVLLLSGCRDEDSRSALEHTARAGDAEAQQQLAYHYLNGIEVDKGRAHGYAAGDALAGLLATRPDSNREDGARAVGLLETSVRAAASTDIEQFEVLAAYLRGDPWNEALSVRPAQ